MVLLKQHRQDCAGIAARRRWWLWLGPSLMCLGVACPARGALSHRTPDSAALPRDFPAGRAVRHPAFRPPRAAVAGSTGSMARSWRV